VLGCGCGVELVVCVSVVRVWLCFGVVVWFFGAVFGWAFGCQRACGVCSRLLEMADFSALSPLIKGGEGLGEGGYEADAFTNFGSAIGKCLCIIFSIPPRPTASSLQPPPHAAKPHPHNNDAASNHPSHDATPFPSSSNEDYNTVNNAHATHTPTNAPNTYESPANDETTHYPNTPPSAHPDALPPALTHPNTAPQPPSDTNPTPPQTLSDAPRPLASPNDLSHSHDPHAHPRAAHRVPCPPPSNYTPKATITQSRFRPKTTPDTPPQLPPFYLLPLGAERFHRRHLWDAGWHIAGALVDIPHPLQVAGQRGGMHLHLHLGR
jgi:hypothetical protein